MSSIDLSYLAQISISYLKNTTAKFLSHISNIAQPNKLKAGANLTEAQDLSFLQSFTSMKKHLSDDKI